MKKEKKLHLKKIKIQNLSFELDKNEQKKVKAGNGDATAVPIFC